MWEVVAKRKICQVKKPACLPHQQKSETRTVRNQIQVEMVYKTKVCKKDIFSKL